MNETGKYKVTNQEQIKLKASLTTKIDYVCNEHCNIIRKRYKSGIFCHNDNRSLISLEQTVINKTIKCEKHKGFY